MSDQLSEQGRERLRALVRPYGLTVGPAPEAAGGPTVAPELVLEAARHYLALGWRVVPVLLGQKAPGVDGWPELRLTPGDLPRYFACPSNVGVLLGEVSGHLADIDLDCPETVELAPRFLPPTMTFGRASKPRSHWLYLSEGAVTEKFLTPALPGNAKRITLVELRANRGGAGGPALQTVFPPSVHTSGEEVKWTTDDGDELEDPRVVVAGELRDRVASLAGAALVARHVGMARTLLWLNWAPFPHLPVGVTSSGLPELSAEAARKIAGQVRQWWGKPVTPPPAPKRTLRAETARSGASFAEAAERYNRDHARALPRSGTGECPVCEHRDCFGELPQSPGRWACFSAGHDGAGLQGETCWTGDALDLDAYAAQLGRAQGYLEGK